jgi:hypothetical protein
MLWIEDLRWAADSSMCVESHAVPAATQRKNTPPMTNAIEIHTEGKAQEARSVLD